MADFTALKTAIQQYIAQNGNKEITGNLLQTILLAMVQSMGDQAINGVLQMLSNEMIARENADGSISQALTAEQQRAIAAETKSAVLEVETNTLVFKNAAGQELYQVSVASLISSGLVDVEVDGTNLVMTFHTESGEKEITIPIVDIFSPSNYYTKTQVDGLLTALSRAITRINDTLHEGALYVGYATPETIPTEHEGASLFYIATEAGEYIHFFSNGDIPVVIPTPGLHLIVGGIEVNDWHWETIVTFTNNVQFNNAQLITSGGVFNAINPINELLHRNYMFAGVANTTTIPTEDTNVFYLAGQGGTYTHFLNGSDVPLVLPKGLTVIYRGVEDDGWNYWTVYADNDFINTNRSQDLSSAQKTLARTNMDVYSKSEVDNLITTPDQEYVTVVATAQTTAVTDLLPATGQADTIYRVGCWDGIQYDATVYSEYSWNGTTYLFLAKKQNGIDSTPTIGSNNFVISDGIKRESLKTIPINSDTELYDPSTVIVGKDIRTDTGVEVDNPNYCCTPFIEIPSANTPLWVNAYGNQLYCYDASQNFIGRTGYAVVGIPVTDYGSQYAATKYVRAIATTANAATIRIRKTEDLQPLNNYLDDDLKYTSEKGVKNKVITKGLLKKVDTNSSTELFDPTTINYGVDINSLGVETSNTQYSSSDFMAVDIHKPLWNNSYGKYVYCYDANKQFLFRYISQDGWCLADLTSSMQNVVYIKVVWENENLDTVRVGYSEKPNYTADFYEYDEVPTYNDKMYALVSSENIKKYVLSQKNCGLPLNKEDFEVEFKTISANDTRYLFYLNVKNQAHVSIDIKKLVALYPSIRMYAETFVSLYGATHGWTRKQDLSGGWTSQNIHSVIYNDGCLVVCIHDSTHALSEQQKMDILSYMVIDYNEAYENSHYIEDWRQGDWTNSSNPSLTTREYKLRPTNWLHLKKGTKIDGFFNGSSETVYVDIWDEATGSVVSINVARTSDFSIELAQDSKVIIVTGMSQQNPVTSDQEVDIRITEYSEKNANNVTRLKIASFNTGNCNGIGLDAGSEEAKAAYRQLITKMDADIICTQEDNMYFNETTQESMQSALFGIFRNYYRLALDPYPGLNFYGYCSDYNLDNVRYVMYQFPYGTERWYHKCFGCAELNKDGRKILLVDIHFDWDDKAIRREQISQLLAYCVGYDYVIIVGDTNPENYVNGSVVSPKYLYEEEWALFSAAGYDMANGGYLGYFDTCWDNGAFHPYDNIFVKGNIKIKNAYVISESWQNDHKPVVAELLIY